LIDPGTGVELQFRLFVAQPINREALFISGPVFITNIQVRKGSGKGDRGLAANPSLCWGREGIDVALIDLTPA